MSGFRSVAALNVVLTTPARCSVAKAAHAARLNRLATNPDEICGLAANPEAGDVIPGADGARKMRWTLPGIGKRGGVRVIYFNYAEDGTVLLAMIYAKGDRANVSSGNIKRVL